MALFLNKKKIDLHTLDIIYGARVRGIEKALISATCELVNVIGYGLCVH
jgi:hypothetical protein